MRGWAGRIEQRVGHPHVEHIIDTEVGVFEQMCGLGVYFKRVVIIKLFWIEWRVTHVASVVASTTFVYEAPDGRCDVEAGRLVEYLSEKPFDSTSVA
jgi:hypothetical protein